MKQEIRSYQAGQMVFSKGDLSDGLYLVESGQVDILEEFEGKETVIATISQGEFLGTITTLLGGGCRIAAARARTDALMRFFSADTFSRTISQLPSWTRSAIRDISSRLRQMNTKFLDQQQVNKRLMLHYGTPYTHANQLISLMLTMSTLVGEQVVLPAQRACDLAPTILRFDRGYCAKILEAMVENSIILVKQIQARDASYIEQEPGILQEFADYLKRASTSGKTRQVDPSLHEWIKAIRAVMQRHPGRRVTLDELTDLLNNFNSRVPTPAIIEQLVSLGVLVPDTLSHPGRILYAVAESTKLVDFDTAAHTIGHLTPKSIAMD